MPVIRRPEYSVWYEQATPQHTFMHCDVHAPWSPKVRALMLRDWETLKALHGGPFHAVHNPGDRLHHKFLTMLGFAPAASYEDDAGCPMEIYATP